VPRVELPPAMPFTLQMTALEDAPVPATLAVNACPAPVDTVAEVGEIPIYNSACEHDDGRRCRTAIRIA
jgi:hypothetical protein